MSNNAQKSEIVLIGGGIMSATLGTLLHELAPDWKITVFERLEKTGAESSDPWNNAGTGHAALCELNYTAQKADGTMDISKATKISEEFQVSRQFWSYIVNKGLVTNPQEFIMPLPHMSMVWGKENVEFLRKRFEALSANPLFKGMEYSEDPQKLSEWIPLIMADRVNDKPLAATRIETGTDINFGALTEKLFDNMSKNGVDMKFRHNVDDMKKTADGWELKITDYATGKTLRHTAKFVFIGCGGGSLHLLQSSGIKEGKGIGGFPVSGIFLVCKKPDIVARHHAKVYGKAPIGSPPMSVPHLDTRVIDGEESLLFGPFAGFSPRFLKQGSLTDLLKSIKCDNLTTMIAAAVNNVSLTVYLIKQLMLSKKERVNELRDFVPSARDEDWELLEAGQRVQVIKDTAAGKGSIQFGTELVSSADGSVAALLGASPGASTAVSVMLTLIEKSFPSHMEEWLPKIKEIVPSYGKKLADNQELLDEITASTAKTLGLRNIIQ